MKKIFFLVLINFFSIAKAQVWDNSFGQNGIIKFIIEGGSTEGEQVISLNEGGLLVGVNSVIPIFHAPDERSFYIYKLHTDGSLNTDFGTNGYFFVPDGGGSEFRSYFFSMEYDALNHSLYILGTVQGIRKLIKLDSFGHLDTSFGVNGMIEFEDFTRIALQNDGKIIVAGDEIFNKKSLNVFHKLARYHPNGALDSSFGISGLIITNLPEYKQEYIRAVKIQNDDKIVVVGISFDTRSVEKFGTIARYTADGTLDTSFGTNGYTITDVGAEKTAKFNDVDISTDGKIIVAGSYEHKNGTGGWGGGKALLVKYSKDGILDETFADKGIKIFNSLNGANDSFKAVKVQDDNKIVAAGNSGNYFPNPLTYFYITRVHSDGEIDQSFFTNGVLISNFNTDEANTVRDLEMDSENNILAIGVTRPPSTAIFNAILCRLSDNTLTVAIVADRSVSLYPNPTTNFLMIRSATSIQKIAMYDVHGKIVLEDNTNYVDTDIIVDIKNLQRGIYFVKLRTQNGTWAQKVMKY